VIGDIKTKVLIVEPKAILHGTVSMMPEKEVSSKKN